MKNECYERGINVSWFEYLRIAVANGWDYAPVINAAFQYAKDNNIGSVIINKKLTVASKVTWPAGIKLYSENVKGYYEGMYYYSSTNTGENGGRIKAIAPISGGMVNFQGENNKIGGAMENIILDANKLADYCLTI